MGNINFLKNLKRKKKLELIELSEEINKSYLEKSESNLISAKILLDSERLEESVSLVYYSSYHLLLALLFKIGIKSENHSGSVILLNELFNLDNSFILFAKKERIDKQYYVDFHITKEEVKELIIKAEEFNEDLLDFISKLVNDDINLYRSKFIKLIA